MKDDTLQIRISTDDKNMLKANAKSLGLSVTDYILSLVSTKNECNDNVITKNECHDTNFYVSTLNPIYKNKLENVSLFDDSYTDKDLRDFISYLKIVDFHVSEGNCSWSGLLDTKFQLLYNRLQKIYTSFNFPSEFLGRGTSL